MHENGGKSGTGGSPHLLIRPFRCFRRWFQPVNATILRIHRRWEMARHYRRLAAADLTALWARWQRGESLLEISEALGTHKSNVWGVVQRWGGLIPPPRRRADRVLQLSDREEISRGLVHGERVRS